MSLIHSGTGLELKLMGPVDFLCETSFILLEEYIRIVRYIEMSVLLIVHRISSKWSSENSITMLYIRTEFETMLL